MRAQHKLVNSTSDKAEFRMAEGRIIGTIFYFNYGNFVLGVCKNSPFWDRVYWLLSSTKENQLYFREQGRMK